MHKAILKHNADVIALCELGALKGGLGPILAKCKKVLVLKSQADTIW